MAVKQLCLGVPRGQVGYCALILPPSEFLLLADVIERLRRKQGKIVYFQMQFYSLHGKFTLRSIRKPRVS